MSSSIARRTFLRQVRATRLSRPNNAQNLQRSRIGAARHASGSGATKATKSRLGSDMPWLLGALIVTIPSTYLILANAPTPSHDDDHSHGDEKSHSEKTDDGDNEDGEEEKGEEKGDDEEKEEENGEDKEKKEDSKDDSGDEEDGDDNDSKAKKVEKSDDSGDSKGDSSSKSSESDNKKAEKKDDKKAEKKDEGSKGKGKFPPHSQEAKQDGLSNSQTSHLTDLSDTSRAPIKSQGGPETAKTPGTIDPKKSGRSSDKM